MKIGILVAMEEEINHLVAEIKSTEIIEIANQKFYDGFIDGKPVTIVQSGIGKVNASIATTLLIQQFNVDAVINTGSAGAIQEGMDIGELVISKELTYHDVNNEVFGYSYGQIPQMPERYTADSRLSQKIEEAAINQSWDIHTGLIVTGDSFVGSTEEIEKIKLHFPSALVTEMEGAAVAQTCSQFDIPYVVIRAVSDTADEEASIDFDEFVILAGKRSSELVISFIKNFN